MAAPHVTGHVNGDRNPPRPGGRVEKSTPSPRNALYFPLNDNEKSNFGDLVSVAEAAKSAIAKLEAH